MVGSLSTSSVKAANPLIIALVESRTLVILSAFSGLERDIAPATPSVILLRPLEISLMLTILLYLSDPYKFFV